MPRKGSVSVATLGERFGRLVVVEASGKSRTCVCDCGGRVTVGRTSALTSGNTASCGCWRKEVTRARSTIHGATADRSYTRAYSSWRAMLDRCTNPKSPKWQRYGARGITVCSQWQSFSNFLAEMGEPPAGMTLNRIDNDGWYGPDNCEWATATSQARNKSTNRVLTFGGQSLCVSEWAENLGVSVRTIMTRLRLGWTVERTLTEGVLGRD